MPPGPSGRRATWVPPGPRAAAPPLRPARPALRPGAAAPSGARPRHTTGPAPELLERAGEPPCRRAVDGAALAGVRHAVRGLGHDLPRHPFRAGGLASPAA